MSGGTFLWHHFGRIPRRLVLLVGLVLAVTLVAGLIVAASLLIATPDRTYSLSAVTETALITVRDPHGLSATIPGVCVLPSRELHCGQATIKVADGSLVSLSRKRDGDLLATIEGGSASLVRVAKGDSFVQQLKPGTSLRIVLERSAPWPPYARMQDSVLVAFRGELRIGEDVGPLVERTMLSGNILVVERQPWFGTRFVVHEATLAAGDVVEWQAYGSRPAEVAGFVQVGYGQALQVTAHAAADHMLVSRFGAAAYELRPTLWNRVARDPYIAGGLSLIAAVAAILAAVDVIVPLCLKLFKRAPKGS